MRWLWWVGPLVVAVVYLVTALWPTRRSLLRRRELYRWLEDYLGPHKRNLPKSKVAKGGPKRGQEPVLAEAVRRSRMVTRLPPRFDELVESSGGGSRLANIVLVPKLAYLAVCAADRQTGSNHQSVVAKLARRAPGMVVRPLPMVDGNRVENTGIEFVKDPEFMDRFLVEAVDEDTEPRDIKRWLKPSLREALMEMPTAWLRTEGRLMAVSGYGELSAERLDELVATADAIFAERGAAGGPSLFSDEDEDESVEEKSRRRERQRRAKKAESPPVATRRVRLSAKALDLGLYLVAALVLVGVLGLGGVAVPDLWTVSQYAEGDGPWQGGWTTKGFGALVAAEVLLTALFVYQTYLAARSGRSIGKLIFGAQVVRQNNEPVHFFRGVLFRTWAVAAVPMVVALVLTRPLGVRAFLSNLTRPVVLLVALVVVAADVAFLFFGEGRCIHDLVAGTKVITAEKLADKLR